VAVSKDRSHGAERVEGPVLRFLQDALLLDLATIDVETDLFDRELIDSFGYVALVAFLEREFAIHIPDEELANVRLRSVASIVAFIEARLKPVR